VSDYNHIEPFCDPTYTPRDVEFSAWKGPFSPGRKCLFQKESHEIVLDYIKQTEEVWPMTPKFTYVGLQDAHTPLGESVRYIDRNYAIFLRWLYDSGAMEKSIVFLVSDHGATVNILANLFKEGRVQSAAPFGMLLVPKKYYKTGGEQQANLQTNQYRFMTALDIHKTLCGILDVRSPQNEQGVDLINQKIPRDRTCAQAGVPPGYCVGVICNGKVAPL